MLHDEKWPLARLIPTSSASGVEAQERKAASALLAVLSVVPDFARGILKPMGAPAGKVTAYIETPFKREGGDVRPDGLITVARGKSTWSALVECKTARNSLVASQIEAYLDVARDNGINAVISISNQYVTSSQEYPIEVNRRKARKVKLRHLSWIDLLTEAIVHSEHREIKDSEQAYILTELVRYLRDKNSGVVQLDSMGQGWTEVRDGARENRLSKTDPAVASVAARWDELVRYLALELRQELGRHVRQAVEKKAATPSARQQSVRESLASKGQLQARLQVENVAFPLDIVADLRSRQIIVSTRIDAPREGRARGRVSWLTRQLVGAPESLKIEARAMHWSTALSATLGQIREDPTILFPEGDRDLRQFVVSSTKNLGVKTRGQGAFIDSVIDEAKGFYRNVVQNLRAWKSPPPKLKPKLDAVETPAALPKPIAEAVEQAEEEMSERAGAPTADTER